MKKLFRSKLRDGNELVMPVGEQVEEIRFNVETREISFTCEDNLAGLSAKQLRKRVETKGGKYTNKKAAIEFLR